MGQVKDQTGMEMGGGGGIGVGGVSEDGQEEDLTWGEEAASEDEG